MSWRSDPPRPRPPIAKRTLGGAAGIDPAPWPELEHGEIPEAVGVVGGPVEVLGEKPANPVGPEVAALEAPGVEQQGLDPPPHRASHPCAGRGATTPPAPVH